MGPKKAVRGRVGQHRSSFVSPSESPNQWQQTAPHLALIVGITGGVLGCGLAYLGFELLPRVAGALGPLALAMTLSPRIVAYSFLIAALIGAASGFIPATLATRGDIATELRAI